MQFAVFNAAPNGTQLVPTLARKPFAVANKFFTIELDFSASIESRAEKYLAIRIFDRTTSGFVSLSPRLPIKRQRASSSLRAKSKAIG
ncbi:MAG: hypothetical protein M3209_15395 [Acidobacteriota bacterium]|nr:hypothetical protein [Acidobacteriota bacterium]